MVHHLAQLNIARFQLPPEHPRNADFIANLDRVNAVAEAQPGFVWRPKTADNNALDLHAFDDPNVIANLSVWTDIEHLAEFVFHNDAHRDIMRRRREWFEKTAFYLVLWWIRAGETPTLAEARSRLRSLEQLGPTPDAFTFRNAFPAPVAECGPGVARRA
jgi:hypothetical protein